MCASNALQLKIDEKSYGYARIYASLLSDEFQRKRAYASILALYAFLNTLEKTPYEIQKAMTLFRNPVINEQYEISDLYVNGWHLDVRVVTGGDAVLIPQVHFDADIVPDFYVVVKVDSELKNAELIGFADKSNLQKEAYDYHYNCVSFDSLISYDEFIEKIKNKKHIISRAEEHELFKESYLGLMDNEIDTPTKNRILKHLFECDECRTEFCCFTGFEMVSCNASKYPELLEDQTLNIIGAQSVDDKKYEGKEETIYIADETAAEEEEEKKEKSPEDNLKREETVSDILDELFSVEDEFEEDSDVTAEKTIINNDIKPILDNDDDLQIIEDNTDKNVLKDEKEQELEIINENNNENSKESIVENEDDVNIIYDESDIKSSQDADIEVIDSKNSDKNDNSDDDILILDNLDENDFSNDNIDDLSIETEDNIQKVIVDYDKNDKPVYSYITPVDKDDAESFSSEIETIDDDENLENSNIEDFSIDEIDEQESDMQQVTSDVTDNDNIQEYNKDIEYTDDIQYQDGDTDDSISEVDLNINNSEYDNPENSIDNDSSQDYEEYEDYQDDDATDEIQDYNDDSEPFEENELNEENEEEYEEEYEDDDIPEEKISKGSSKITLVLLSIVILIFMIGGGAFFLLKSKNNTETSAAETTADNNSVEVQNQQVSNDMFEQPISAETSSMLQNDTKTVNNDAQLPVENPMTGAIPSSGTISVPPLTESDLIKPVQRQSHGDVNKAIANAFAQTGNGVSLRGLNWFCTSELFSDRTFKDYLQNLDNSLKQNLKNNILNATQIPPKDSVTAKFAVDNNGNLQKVIISESSGLEEIDNIVLQSIKESFEGEKSMILNDSALKSDMYYLKVVIKL